MPIYLYSCPDCSHSFEKFRPVAQWQREEPCPVCLSTAKQVITAPIVIIPAHMRADAQSGYESPIDGRNITTTRGRREDMARNGCIEYEPGMRQDTDQRVKDDEKALDAMVDDTVEREIAALPTAKRESLEREIEAGVTTEMVRAA